MAQLFGREFSLRFAVSVAVATSLAGCGPSASYGEMAFTAVRLAVLEGTRAVADEAARHPSSPSAAPLDGPHGETLFFCRLDSLGGEELYASDAADARARCESLHGERSDPEHCRCGPP